MIGRRSALGRMGWLVAGALVAGRSGAARAAHTDAAILMVDGGGLDAPRFFTLEGLEALGMESIRTTTPWLPGETLFQGPRLAVVLDRAGVKGQQVQAWALNDYHAVIPMDDVRHYPVMLSTRINGAPIPVRKHGPLFIIYPFDTMPALRSDVYFSRSVWQVRHLHVT